MPNNDKPEKPEKPKAASSRKKYDSYCMGCDCYLGRWAEGDSPLWCRVCRDELPD